MITSIEDLKIIREFLLLKSGSTTWRVMKRIYPTGSNNEHMKVLRGIKRMEKQGLFVKQNKEYILIKDKVRLNKIPKMETFIAVKDIDDSWSIFEI